MSILTTDVSMCHSQKMMLSFTSIYLSDVRISISYNNRFKLFTLLINN